MTALVVGAETPDPKSSLLTTTHQRSILTIHNYSNETVVNGTKLKHSTVTKTVTEIVVNVHFKNN